MGPGGGETEQDPMWLLGTAAFPRPLFPVCRERTPHSTSFPESHREDSRGGWSGKGVDAETREDQPGKSSSASGRVWSASRDTHDRSFELFMEQKPPTSGRCQRSLFRGRLVLMLSHQVESSSLQPVVHQAPLSMGFPRQEYWEWVAISSSRGSSHALPEVLTLVLRPSFDLPLFCFHGFFPSLSLATAILDSCFLFFLLP